MGRTKMKYGVPSIVNGVRNPEYRKREWLAYRNSDAYAANAQNRKRAQSKFLANNRERVLQQQRKSKHKAIARGLGYRACVYGAKPQDIDLMWKEQKGLCAICSVQLTRKRGPTSAHIDHDHNNNRVRAILCRRCNHLLGNCRESIEILAAAIEYLDRHEGANWRELK